MAANKKRSIPGRPPRAETKPKLPRLLNDKQVDELAKKLHGTRSNVYSLAQQMFNQEVGEEVFEQLKTIGKIFRCELCDEWKTLDCRIGKNSEICTDDHDGDEDDEDDD